MSKKNRDRNGKVAIFSFVIFVVSYFIAIFAVHSSRYGRQFLPLCEAMLIYNKIQSFKNVS